MTYGSVVPDGVVKSLTWNCTDYTIPAKTSVTANITLTLTDNLPLSGTFQPRNGGDGNSMNKNLKIALAIFALSVVLLTGLDYVVNMDLYNYGLEFSMDWATTYWTFYALAYQLIVFACWRITFVCS